MVRTPLHPCPCGLHEMHMCPHRERNLGPLQDVPPVPGSSTPSWTGTHPTRWHNTPDGKTGSLATQKLATIPRQAEVREAVRRGLVPAAVYTLLQTHADNPHATAAHMQRTAVAKTAEQLTYRTHKYLQHAATLPPADQSQLLKILLSQPCDPTQQPTTRRRTPPPPRTTPKWHTRALQAPHTHPPACTHRKLPCPNATICPQVPPTACQRMPRLCAPTAITGCPTLQPKPLGLPKLAQHCTTLTLTFLCFPCPSLLSLVPPFSFRVSAGRRPWKKRGQPLASQENQGQQLYKAGVTTNPSRWRVSKGVSKGLHTASPTAPTVGTSTPRTARSPQP